MVRTYQPKNAREQKNMALEKECLQETAVKFWPAEEQKAEKY